MLPDPGNSIRWRRTGANVVKHPVFDRPRFPRAREDARAFLGQLKQVVSVPSQIGILYQTCGGNIIDIDTRGAPSDIWDDVIQKLATRGLLRRLCEVLLEDPQYRMLHDVTRALIDAGEREVVEQAITPPTDIAQLNKFLSRCIARVRSLKGMTLLLSPYAAYDVHNEDDPRKVGEKVFFKSFEQRFHEYQQEMQSDGADLSRPDFANDILSNLLVATSGSYAISADYENVWQWLCDTHLEDDDPLDLHGQITRLASICHDLFSGSPSNVEWSGLLIVSLDVTSRLETALSAEGVEFGILRLNSDGSISHNRHLGRMRFSDVSPVPANCLPQDLEPVLVLKLMGCRNLNDGRRPILGLEVLSRFRELGTLPNLLQLHLQKKPFVMLGGGLIDPFLALCLEALVRPMFAQVSDFATRNSRWVVLHPSSPGDSVVRNVEIAIDTLNPDWTLASFDLHRLVFDLPSIANRMGDRISDSAPVADPPR